MRPIGKPIMKKEEARAMLNGIKRGASKVKAIGTKVKNSVKRAVNKVF